jgi:hypothetical protein
MMSFSLWSFCINELVFLLFIADLNHINGRDNEIALGFSLTLPIPTGQFVESDTIINHRLSHESISNNAFDFAIFIHAVYDMCSIENTAPCLERHMFKHRLAELRLDYRRVGLHYCVAFGIQPFEPFLADTVNNAGNTCYISVGAKAAEGLTYFKKYPPFPRPGRGYGSRATPGTAAVYNHVCVKLSTCCKHSFSPFDNNVRVPLRPHILSFRV